MLGKTPKFFFRIFKLFLNKEVYARLKEKYNKSCNPQYEIVSLGASCYPKTIFTRKKYKRTKAQGEKTLPFDLVWVHEAVFITEFIKNNFEGFFSDLRYIDNINCWDNFYKVNFSHETSFGPNDKDLLIKKYTKRIEHFNALLKSEKPILFVQFLKTPSVGEDVNNLYLALKEKRDNKTFELLVIDTIDIVKEPLPQVNVLKLKLPYDNVDLYDKSFYKSSSGKEFEKNILKKCDSIIKKKFKLNPTKFL